MTIDDILSELKQERDRLEQAIGALEGTNGKRAYNRHRRSMSADARARISRQMKKNWAKRKSAKTNAKKTPAKKTLHWTQRPENKKRLQAQLKRAVAASVAKTKGTTAKT